MTALFVPHTRPEMDRAAAESLLRALHVDLERPALLGRRGYYRDTMGVSGVNDIGIYDDAIMLISPASYVTFNANCDPTRIHAGVATLKTGVWRYRIGTHGLSRPIAQRYEALVQAADVTVVRAPDARHPERWEETGRFGINIHRGGINTTSSEGCQTIVAPQYAGFLELVRMELERFRATEIPYALTERGGPR